MEDSYNMKRKIEKKHLKKKKRNNIVYQPDHGNIKC